MAAFVVIGGRSIPIRGPVWTPGLAQPGGCHLPSMDGEAWTSRINEIGPTSCEGNLADSAKRGNSHRNSPLQPCHRSGRSSMVCCRTSAGRRLTKSCCRIGIQRECPKSRRWSCWRMTMSFCMSPLRFNASKAKSTDPPKLAGHSHDADLPARSIVVSAGSRSGLQHLVRVPRRSTRLDGRVVLE